MRKGQARENDFSPHEVLALLRVKNKKEHTRGKDKREGAGGVLKTEMAV
jgi:hypothetical protein